MYDVLQFLHVAAAIVWLGSGVGLVALTGVMAKAGDRATLMTTSRYIEPLGPRLFGASAMGTLIFGILAVLTGEGISFGDTWIVIGLVGVALSLVIVGLNNGVNKRLTAAVEQHGPDHPEVEGAIRQGRLYNYVDLVILFIVVWAMVVKPGAGG
jgi:uncharacterized membrane protein